MAFVIEEATIADMQTAMESGEITSKELVLRYLERIADIDKDGPKLNSVLELNPDALFIADALDDERFFEGSRGPLHGIPVMIKDNIDTVDKMHTSAGSLAMADSYAAKDAFLVEKLRDAGAVILGKTNLTEFANVMANGMPAGYSSRGGQVLNPYNASISPSGSSAGSAVAVAANLCAATVGTETSGSILSPSCRNCIIGIKPTVGLISRSGVMPISNTMDTPGPMTRTVRDGAILLGAMTGVDRDDPATWVSKRRGHTDYTQFLDRDGLKGARIGINRAYIDDFNADEVEIIESAIAVLHREGVEVVEHTDIPSFRSSSIILHEFKINFNAYLAKLGPNAPIHSMKEIIDFNNEHRITLKYGQARINTAEYETSGMENEAKYIRDRIDIIRKTETEGIDAVIKLHKLDAILCPGVSNIVAFTGYPCINVPAGFSPNGVSMGVSFCAGAYSEPTLFKLAYAFEQATRVRRAPKL